MHDCGVPIHTSLYTTQSHLWLAELGFSTCNGLAFYILQAHLVSPFTDLLLPIVRLGIPYRVSGVFLCLCYLVGWIQACLCAFYAVCSPI